MSTTNSRNEEVKCRVDAWEAEHQKNLRDCSREEWVTAMQGIMAMTQQEAEEYLDHLQMQSGL